VVKLFCGIPCTPSCIWFTERIQTNPTIGFLGSSNPNTSGLSKQGELNVDVLDHDACKKLQTWFEDQWLDPWCVDISKETGRDHRHELGTGGAAHAVSDLLDMAYHLSQEARAGFRSSKFPRISASTAPVSNRGSKDRCSLPNKRGGVVIGDVVGLGKTFHGGALARIFQGRHRTETLIICPKNLVSMWQDYVHQYRMAAKVMSISSVINELPDTPRYRLVLDR